MSFDNTHNQLLFSQTDLITLYNLKNIKLFFTYLKENTNFIKKN